MMSVVVIRHNITVDRQHRLIGASICRLSRIGRDHDDSNDTLADDVERCERLVTFQHHRVLKATVADRVVRHCRNNGGIDKPTVLVDMCIVVQAYLNG